MVTCDSANFHGDTDTVGLGVDFPALAAEVAEVAEAAEVAEVALEPVLLLVLPPALQ